MTKDTSIRILQYGEGNFLRAFADYMIDIANERACFQGTVAIVKPIPHGSLDNFQKQDCRYSVVLRGVVDGETCEEIREISCVSKVLDPHTQYEEYLELAKLDTLRFVISNTTEAGIAFCPNDRITDKPPSSYPGKLTQFLYYRWKYFAGAKDKGLIILPVELIEYNGRQLFACVMQLIEHWGLEKDFKDWVCTSSYFCSTLVDRVVTGFPKDGIEELWQKVGYSDQLLVTGEPFALWAIEGDRIVAEEFSLDKAGLPVVFTDDLSRYRERKVRILNGAHTATALAAYLSGLDTVSQCMSDPVFAQYMESMVYQEIAPTVPLDSEEVASYAQSVFERFKNPFVKHCLLSITLNSVSKWKTRILPTVEDYYEMYGKLPNRLAFSLAALIAFYSSNVLKESCLIGYRDQETYMVRDDHEVVTFFANTYGQVEDDADYVMCVCKQKEFWGRDLCELPGFVDAVTKHYKRICAVGSKEAVRLLLEEN